MKSRNYKKFEDPKLQKMVIEEIKDRMGIGKPYKTDPEEAAKSITAFMACNFNPNSDLMRCILDKRTWK